MHTGGRDRLKLDHFWTSVTLTLTLDRVIRYIVTHQPLSTHEISLKLKTFCGRTEGRTDRRIDR